MLRVLRERLRQRHRTISFPGNVPALPPRFRGAPRIDISKCTRGCSECIEVCPQGAIGGCAGGIRIDLGRCVLCGECVTACPAGVIALTSDYRMATNSRESLVCTGGDIIPLARQLDPQRLSILRHSLKLRQVSAGGCNACEADVNVLGTVVFDLGMFGIQVVASPRHADGILVTGPVTENMRHALIETYQAMPSPKMIIASGSCAITGGPFRDSAHSCNGVDSFLKVDLYIPGCPPHPLTVLDGILRLLGRLPDFPNTI